jgi:endonuclease/exonuclease/phosphatase family metal-dependent hydrolase
VVKIFSKKVLIILNVIAVVALGIAYLSNYISPAKVWYFAFFGLAYPVLLLLNIGFVVFWFFISRKHALISLFAILVGFSFIGRFWQFGFSSKPLNKASSFKVMSYNVRLFNYYKWENENGVRDSIIKFVNHQSPDIICFQDFFTKKAKASSERYIRDNLSGLPYCQISYTFSLKDGTDYGLATFSKYPIVKKGRIHFRNSFNSCIYSDIAIDKDTVRVFNVHLQSIKLGNNNYGIMDSIFSRSTSSLDDIKDFSDHLRDAFIKRARQVDQLVLQINQSPYPVIVCGDFNDTPVSYTYEQILGNKTDAYRKSGWALGNTYRGKLPSYRIDYIFYDQNFTSGNFRTHRVKLSDHYPVSCSLKKID